jgi:hypothetical protein
MERLSDLCIPASYDRTLARRAHAPQPAAPINMDPNEDDRYPPFPRILHPWPEKRFLVTIQGGSSVRWGRPPGSVRGAESNLGPYRDLRIAKDFVHACSIGRSSHVFGL